MSLFVRGVLPLAGLERKEGKEEPRRHSSRFQLTISDQNPLKRKGQRGMKAFAPCFLLKLVLGTGRADVDGGDN